MRETGSSQPVSVETSRRRAEDGAGEKAAALRQVSQTRTIRQINQSQNGNRLPGPTCSARNAIAASALSMGTDVQMPDTTRKLKFKDKA